MHEIRRISEIDPKWAKDQWSYFLFVGLHFTYEIKKCSDREKEGKIEFEP